MPRPRQGRVHEPWRERERSSGRCDARGRRAQRRTAPRRNDHRSDERKHGDGSCNGRRDPRLSLHSRHARQDVERKNRPLARLRRRSRRYADERLQRFAGIILFGREPARRRYCRRVHSGSVAQSHESGCAFSNRPGRRFGIKPKAASRISCAAWEPAGRSPERRVSSRKRTRTSSSPARIRKARSTPATRPNRTKSRESGCPIFRKPSTCA